MLSADEIKQQVGEHAATLVQNNTIIGVGTGTTAYWLIRSLAKRIEQGLNIKAVPTSLQTKALAEQWGIPIAELNDVDSIALTIDGADEIDPKLQLIKGGGGALLQEKMVAAASKELIIIVDHTKVVAQLGKFPLPVEVIPFGWKQVAQHIHALGCGEVVLRQKEGKVFVSDHGHYILDCHFGEIADAGKLTVSLNMIPGVVDNGLFVGLASRALVGYPDGSIREMK